MQLLWKKGTQVSYFWVEKKGKECDIENLFVGATFIGEVSKSNKDEDLE